jgi:hypothetical protein
LFSISVQTFPFFAQKHFFHFQLFSHILFALATSNQFSHKAQPKPFFVLLQLLPVEAFFVRVNFRACQKAILNQKTFFEK